MFLILGATGIGKTSFVAQFPGTYWIIDEKEVGILDLIDSGKANIDISMVRSPVESWSDLIGFNDGVLSGAISLPDTTKTLVYESITGLELFCHSHCCMLRYNNDWSSQKRGFMFYKEGYRTAANEFWTMAVSQWCKLREMGFNVVVTGHSKKKTMANVDSADYLYEGCICEVPTWEVMSPYFENIFFLTFDVDAAKETDFAKGKVSTSTRLLMVSKTPLHDAKNKMFKNDIQSINAEQGPVQLYADMCKLGGLNPLTLKFQRRE